LTTIYKDVNMGPSKGFLKPIYVTFYVNFILSLSNDPYFFKWQVKCCCPWLCRCISFIHCGTFSCPTYTWNIQPLPSLPDGI